METEIDWNLCIICGGGSGGGGSCGDGGSSGGGGGGAENSWRAHIYNNIASSLPMYVCMALANAKPSFQSPLRFNHNSNIVAKEAEG